MKENCYRNQSVLIVGLGVSGRSAAYFLLGQGAVVTGIDRDLSVLMSHPEIISLITRGLKFASEDLSCLNEFDLIVMSPGIPPTHPIYQPIKRQNKPVIGEIELGCRSASRRILGITGTNGKTTVTLLTAHVLNQTNRKARALGNVGIP